MKIERFHMSALVACLFLLGCAGHSGASSTGDTRAGDAMEVGQSDEPAARPISEPIRHPAGSGRIEIPAGLRLPGVDTVRVAPNWEHALSLYSQEERSELQARNTAYFDALRFTSEREQRQMVEQGFPMPEEWLAARNIPDDQLKQWAEGGNSKAQVFYIDRAIAILSPVLEKRGLDMQNENDRALFRLFVQASQMAADRLSEHPTPFAAYQLGLFRTRTSQGQPLEPFAAGIHIAADLGHARAESVSALFYRQHPRLSAGTVMNLYQNMRGDIRRP